MKSLVCQAHLELNPLLYGQPVKLTKNLDELENDRKGLSALTFALLKGPMTPYTPHFGD